MDTATVSLTWEHIEQSIEHCPKVARAKPFWIGLSKGQTV